jgi:hypothetical protein
MDLALDQVGPKCKFPECGHTADDPFLHFAFYHLKLGEKLDELNIDRKLYSPIRATDRALVPFK